MYGIFTYIGVVSGVNVDKYATRGVSGYGGSCSFSKCQDWERTSFVSR